MRRTMLYQYMDAVKCEKRESYQTFYDARNDKEIKIQAGGNFYYDGILLRQYQICQLLQSEAKEPHRFYIRPFD